MCCNTYYYVCNQLFNNNGALTVVIEFCYFSALWVFIGSVLLEWLFIKIYKFIEKIDDVHTVLLNRKGLDI